MYQRALSLQEVIYGPWHAFVATTLHQYGELLLERKQLDEACRLLQRAVIISGRVFGPQHMDVTPRLLSLANAYKATGKVADAEVLLNRALNIHEEPDTPSYLDVADISCSLAAVQRMLNLHEEASDLLYRALDIYHDVSPGSMDVAQACLRLGSVLFHLGQAEEARSLYEEALPIMERELGPNDPELAVAAVELARVLLGLNLTVPAYDALRRAVSIRVQFLGFSARVQDNVVYKLAAVALDDPRYLELWTSQLNDVPLTVPTIMHLFPDVPILGGKY